jgi:hypothetical protein
MIAYWCALTFIYSHRFLLISKELCWCSLIFIVYLYLSVCFQWLSIDVCRCSWKLFDALLISSDLLLMLVHVDWLSLTFCWFSKMLYGCSSMFIVSHWVSIDFRCCSIGVCIDSHWLSCAFQWNSIRARFCSLIFIDVLLRPLMFYRCSLMLIGSLWRSLISIDIQWHSIDVRWWSLVEHRRQSMTINEHQ